jgi:hypothetical protein
MQRNGLKMQVKKFLSHKKLKNLLKYLFLS